MRQLDLGHVAGAYAKSNLTKRDLKILDAITEHRFLRADQIRRLLFHDLGSPESRARTCSRVLNRLAGDRLVQVLDRRIGGERRGSAAGVWCLGTQGVRLMKRAGRHVTRPHVTGRPEFLQHTLAVAEAHVQLIEASRAGRFELSTIQLEPEAWREYPGPLGSPLSLRPDLFVVTASTEYEAHRFVEIDLATESLPRINHKCHRYQAYYQTGIEQAANSVFPAVLWVVPDKRRADAIKAAIAGDTGIDRNIFDVVLAAEMINKIAAL